MRIPGTDSGAVVAVTPGHIVSVLDPPDAGVILMLKSPQPGDIADKLDGLLIYLPMYPVLAFSTVNAHLAPFVVHAKDACEFVPERNDGTIKDAV